LKPANLRRKWSTIPKAASGSLAHARLVQEQILPKMS
jgi:hypothetical protein